jgi:hypothetical protein
MAARAKATVALSHEGSVHVFVKGDKLPDWAVAEITNPEVVDQPEPETGEADGGADSDSSEGTDGAQPDGAGGDSAGDGDSGGATGDQAPPADKPAPVKRTRTRKAPTK